MKPLWPTSSIEGVLSPLNVVGADTLSLVKHVIGIDFSGARDAGKKIWLAICRVEGSSLRLADLCRADSLPHSGLDRTRCLQALRELITASPATAFGLDFPLGLPHSLVKEDGWESFVLSFGDHYRSPEQFRASCWLAAGGAELRRATDRQARTPFSPYSRRICSQTYYGIRDLLGSLVQRNLACVVPMQNLNPSLPYVMEVCPASTLKRERLYQP